MQPPLTNEALLGLGINVAWMPRPTHMVTHAALYDKVRELDPNFVVMAQCYAGEAANGGLPEALQRMKMYREIAEVDWVQFTAPRSVDEVKQARQEVQGPLSIMQGFMQPPLTNEALHLLPGLLDLVPRGRTDPLPGCGGLQAGARPELCRHGPMLRRRSGQWWLARGPAADEDV